MTKEEFDKVARILAQADSGCSVCAKLLAKDAKAVWPEFDWEARVEFWLEEDL